jgi:YD repeat-containing protein
MPRLFAVAILLLTAANLQAQYYYQDILTPQNTSRNYQLLRRAGITRVVAQAHDADGTPTENFSIEQEIKKSSNELVTRSYSDITGSSFMVTTFNQIGLPTMVTDSANNIVNQIMYNYNAKGSLMSITSYSFEPNFRDTLVETRTYIYKDNQPVSMIKVKTGGDTTEVRFLPDENGKPGTEQWWKKGRKLETWYYYYDKAGNLTDVVRYNDRANRMLPDYTFEYNAQGQLTQQIIFKSGSNQYRIWQFAYDNRGLRTSETVMNKQRQPEGRIVYQYQ